MPQQHRARRAQLALLGAVLSGVAMALPTGVDAAAAQPARVGHIAQPDGVAAPDDAVAPDVAPALEGAPAPEDAPAPGEGGHDAVSAEGDVLGVMPLYAIGALMLIGAAAAAVSRRQRD